MILEAAMTVTILVIAGTLTGPLPEEIDVIHAPLIIDDSLSFSFDSYHQDSFELYVQLGLIELWGAGDFTNTPFVQVEVKGAPILLLVFLDCPEEMEGRLISISNEGCILDWIPVYYWNSEGFVSLHSFIDIDGTIIRNELVYIDFIGDSISADTFSVMENGTFAPAGGD